MGGMACSTISIQGLSVFVGIEAALRITSCQRGKFTSTMSNSVCDEIVPALDETGSKRKRCLLFFKAWDLLLLKSVLMCVAHMALQEET